MAPARRPGAESEVTALHTASSPLVEDSPYHAFAGSPPTALFGKPCRWPGPEASATTARLLWSQEALYVCWELEGTPAQPVDPAQVEPGCLAGLEGGQVQPGQRSVLLDERVECFLWQPREPAVRGEAGEPAAKRPKAGEDGDFAGQAYYAFEVNYAGKALTNRARFGGPMGFDWGGEAAYSSWTQEVAVGWGGSASPVPSAVAGLTPPFKRVVACGFKWAAMGMDLSREIWIGLHRAEHHPEFTRGRPARLAEEEVRRLLAGMVWSSWVDPGDAVVNFHRPACFGKLVLAPPGLRADCSCRAARLLRPGSLRVLPSPKPCLAECPPGSLLVQAKYASVCGSDMPYFKAKRLMAPSCYWDRDGFCGHEVVGVVLESKSAAFKPGDAVMALPSSYFKAHAGSKQEWYREDVHGVLLQNFPVRGGFSQVYTSHELYSYRIRECVPRMLAAQGLGTILRMARRLGPVLGKTVVVLGQGQNGLMATRLMAQFCAKAVIAVDPLEYRRDLALTFGASRAVSPDDAAGVIAEMTGGRGADVVLEMVGHNQDTINAALEHVACAGTVVAFGVPDDAVYGHFEFSKFFRKNVNLVASVIPDPGTDFPEAVRLIEEGRFSTEGIFTHVLQLAEVEKAFSIASSYAEGVVKLVVEL